MIERLKQAGVIPVIAIEEWEKATDLAEALCDGGLPCIEITFRTRAAAKAISEIAKKCGRACVGAGTVLHVAQAQEAIDNGAKFIVSPGSDFKVMEYVLSKGVTMIPGVVTPTEIANVLSFGLKTMKFFPAENFGGIRTVRSLSAPYPDVRWIPTGGIDRNNLSEYLAFEKVLACGASSVAKGDLIAGGRFDVIRKNAEEFSAIVKRSGEGQ